MDLSDTLLLRNLTLPETYENEQSWQNLAPGVEIAYLYRSEQGPAAALIRYQPGASVRRHRHLGYEHVFVLRGAQHDERHVYKTGSLAIQPPGSEHKVVSTEGCLVLVMWSLPVEMIEEE